MDLIIKEFNELTNKELYEILKSRAAIFIIEQNINYQDLDDIDYKSLHCFYKENDKVIAYLRAFYKDDNKDIAYLRAFYKDDNKDIVKIGRVLTLKHNQGLGRKLLTESLPQIIKIMKPKKITMDAQKYAIGFYQKFGFQVVSDEFIEEEILHVIMELDV